MLINFLTVLIHEFNRRFISVETLRHLYQMLDTAHSQSDIDEIKSKIQETINKMEHAYGGGNKY